jgi:hypothetical protein
MAGSQLLLGYWFYAYVIWFFPLLLLALIAAKNPGDRAVAVTG